MKGIRVKPYTVAYIRLDADIIDFDATYTFEVVNDGRLYLWTGARPVRDGDAAVFDYGAGKNGVMIVASESMKNILSNDEEGRK